MHALAISFPSVAVSAIYCLWHAYQGARLRRELLLRQRVAYLLWAVASLPDPEDEPPPVSCGPSHTTPLPPGRGPIVLPSAEAPPGQGRPVAAL